jgi:hypothetical protein
MSNWKQLEKDISEWLSTFASADIKFRRKFPVGDFISDGMLITDEILVAVEVEAGQRHPDTNVGKYWWLTARKPYRRIVLFHVYAPGFKPNESRKELGRFYAKQMQDNKVPIEYIFRDCTRREPEGYSTILGELKAEISAKIEQEFGSALGSREV